MKTNLLELRRAAMKKYCDVCKRETETKIVCKTEAYNVCGEEITIDAEILTCIECGEELYNEELDNATLTKVYNIYRERHRLLYPSQIREIREQYGLSQRSFAQLLNWGDKTIHRYENGALQDKAHNSLLLFLREPENMRAYLADNEVVLSDRQREKLLQKIETLEISAGRVHSKKMLERFYWRKPSIENGFKAFDYDKFCAMVLFFAHKCKGIFKVKLLKLLNYSDMIFYQKNGVSISGMRYIHLPYGPVPENYDLLFGVMEAEKIVHIEVEFDHGYEKHRVMPDCKLDKNVLSEAETEVLEQIYKKFADFGSGEISDYSHCEKGYRSTARGEVISYAYAKDIRLI